MGWPAACTPSRAQQITSAAAISAWTQRDVRVDQVVFVGDQHKNLGCAHELFSLVEAAGLHRCQCNAWSASRSTTEVVGRSGEGHAVVANVSEHALRTTAEPGIDLGGAHLQSASVIARHRYGGAFELIDVGAPSLIVELDPVGPHHKMSMAEPNIANTWGISVSTVTVTRLLPMRGLLCATRPNPPRLRGVLHSPLPARD